MIRSGRCDECRRQKRKCDEARPACSRCTDRGCQCVYSTKISRFVHLYRTQSDDASSSDSTSSFPDPGEQATMTNDKQFVLSVRSSRLPPSGDGLYQTLKTKPAESAARPRKRDPKPPPTPSISPPPCSKTVRLQNEFGAILQSASSPGLRMRLWGDWQDMVVPRIGKSTVLDLSVSCLIEGHKAMYACDPHAAPLGRHRYGQALKALKSTVAGGASCVDADVIAATKLLMNYEIVIGSGMTAWLSHSYGTVDLCLALGPEAYRGKFEQALFSNTYIQAWRQAVLAGKPSVFDTPEWLEQEPPPIRVHLGIQRTFYQVFTRLPRLTVLVRSLGEDPTDSETADEAVGLATDLLGLVWHADDEWDVESNLHPTVLWEDATLLPLSFAHHLTETEYYRILARCSLWSSKIMLSGLCQTLYTHGAPISWPSLSELYQEEERCAMLIAMSLDYFEKMQPYGVAPILLSVQIAWGAYWRRWRRTVPRDADAKAMADYLKRRNNKFMAIVNAPGLVDDVKMATFNGRLMGAPAMSITGDVMRRWMQLKQQQQQQKLC